MLTIGTHGGEVMYVGCVCSRGDTTGDDSDLIYVHTRVRVGPYNVPLVS